MDTAIWFGIMVVTAVIEALTAGLVTIWFTFGALASLIAAALGASTFWQIIIFILVSALLLLATRPLVKKHLLSSKTSTNADRLIGKECIVTEEINTLEGKGTVKVLGQVWSAKSEDGNIPEGTLVKIKKIEGVHVFVAPVTQKKEEE